MRENAIDFATVLWGIPDAILLFFDYVILRGPFVILNVHIQAWHLIFVSNEEIMSKSNWIHVDGSHDYTTWVH